MYSMRLYDEKKEKACRGLRGPFLYGNGGMNADGRGWERAGGRRSL